jgi:hypothetical protein
VVWKVQGVCIQRAYEEKVLSLRRWGGTAGVDVSNRERKVEWNKTEWNGTGWNGSKEKESEPPQVEDEEYLCEHECACTRALSRESSVGVREAETESSGYRYESTSLNVGRGQMAACTQTEG